MAPINKVKERLAGGGVAFGTWLQTASPTVANVLAQSGMDFVTIDMEHGPQSFSEAEAILYAVEAGGSTPMIRLGEGSEPTILRALDIGCQSVLVAHCQSGEEADGIVRATRFHPHGVRGMAPFTRLHNWSADRLSDKLAEANEQQLTGVLVEDANGLSNLDDILAVDGLDVVYVGIYDLSQVLGLAGQVEHPLVLDTVTDAAQRIASAGKVPGAVCRDRDHLAWLLATGFRYISYLCDTALIQAAARGARAEFESVHA
ncbi:MAG: aldolase/citrate lyase family protein [Actinomycetota bacterium]|nr:aldolase/citrate lyase family protein [Actinomycetota bacterium]